MEAKTCTQIRILFPAKLTAKLQLLVRSAVLEALDSAGVPVEQLDQTQFTLFDQANQPQKPINKSARSRVQ